MAVALCLTQALRGELIFIFLAGVSKVKKKTMNTFRITAYSFEMNGDMIARYVKT